MELDKGSSEKGFGSEKLENRRKEKVERGEFGEDNPSREPSSGSECF